MFFYSSVHIAMLVFDFHVWIPVDLNCHFCSNIEFVLIIGNIW